jgi:hypothetical protein
MVRVGSASSHQGIVQPTFPISTEFVNTVYPFIQSFPFSTITSSNVGTSFSTFNFTLGALARSATFVALFDMYRIRLIEMEFIPGQSEQSTGGSNAGLFLTVVDNNDSSPLATFNEGLGRTDALVGGGCDSQRRTFVPHVADAVYSGAFTSFGSVASPWLDCNSANVQHYGLKTAWSPSTTNGLTMNVVARAWIEFKNIK